MAERLGIRLLELGEIAGAGGGEVEVNPRRLSARAGSMIRLSRTDVLIATHIVFRPRGYTPRVVVVLRRSPTELLRELRKRGYSEEKVLENVEAELLGLVYAEALRIYGRSRVSQVNASSRSLEGVAGLVEGCVMGRRVDEEVDWIAQLEGSGELSWLLPQLSRRLSGL